MSRPWKVPLFILLFVCCSVLLCQGAQHTAKKENAISRLLTLFKSSTHLLEDVDKHKVDDTEKQKKVDQIKREIRALQSNLINEDAKWVLLKMQQDAIKRKQFTWFLDPELRKQVDIIQLELNDQQRKIDNIVDDINVHWKNIKPLYGIFSKLFLNELIGVVPLTIELVGEMLGAILLFDFMSLVFFGPVVTFFLGITFSLGFVPTLSYIFTFALFFGSLYWLIELPFIMVQYNPTLLQFAIVYLPCVAAFFGVTWMLGAVLNYLTTHRNAVVIKTRETPTSKEKTISHEQPRRVKAE